MKNNKASTGIWAQINKPHKVTYKRDDDLFDAMMEVAILSWGLHNKRTDCCESEANVYYNKKTKRAGYSCKECGRFTLVHETETPTRRVSAITGMKGMQALNNYMQAEIDNMASEDE